MEQGWFWYSLSGLLVGLVVGLTGVGGGSLMTPILIYLGIPPLKAVGTDLLYAAFTKVGGVFMHARKRNIEWRIVGFLLMGSLPASLATLGLMTHWGMNESNSGMTIRLILGISLILTAISIVLRQILPRRTSTTELPAPKQWSTIGTVITGFVLGALVTISSVGAGAIGAAVLIILYPRLSLSKIVGIDIAHAVPLTLLAGLGHSALGGIHWQLLLSLLLGSIPGIMLGSWLSPKTSDRVLKPIMAILLAGIGFSMV